MEGKRLLSFDQKVFASSIQLIAALFLFSCSSYSLDENLSDKLRPMNKNIIEVRAEVSRFVRDAAFDHFSDGSYAAYDQTSFNIFYPVEYQGIQLNVQHDKRTDPSSAWVSIGRKVSFNISEALLNNNSVTVNSEFLLDMVELLEEESNQSKGRAQRGHP